MKSIVLVAGLALAALTAAADDYFWNNAGGGDWSVAANWKLGSTGTGGDAPGAPGESDTAYFCMGTYTITLSENVRVYKVFVKNQDRNQPCFVTIDLKGFKMETLTESGTDGYVAYGDVSHQRAGLTFVNGQVYSTGGAAVAIKAETAWTGNLVLDNVTGALTNGLAVQGAYPRLVVTNGTKLAIGGNLGGRVCRRTDAVDIVGPDVELDVAGAINFFGPQDVRIRGGVWIHQGQGIFSVAGYEQDYGGEPAGQRAPRVWLDNVTVTNTGIRTELRLGVDNMGCALTLTNHTVLTGYGYCKVGGYQGEVYSQSNRLEIVDESLLDLNGFESAGSRTCDGMMFAQAAGTSDNTLYVSNGTYRGRFLYIGDDTVTSSGRCATNNWIHLAGTHPLVNTIQNHYQGFSMWMRSGSGLRFDIGKDGYEDAPVRIQGILKITHPEVAPYDTVKSRLRISARAFDRAHPKASLTLIQTNNDSTTALQELVENCMFDSADHGELSIEDGGKKLVYTAPPRKGLLLLFR